MRFLVFALFFLLSSQAWAEDVLVLVPTNCQMIGTTPGFYNIPSFKAQNVVGVCRGAPLTLFCTWWFNKKITGTSVFKKSAFHSTRTYMVFFGTSRNESLVVTGDQHFSHTTIQPTAMRGRMSLLTKVCTGQTTITPK